MSEQEQDRALLQELFQRLMRLDNAEHRNIDQIREARATYAACEEWYAQKHAVVFVD